MLHFFFGARFALFCARFACFRARFAQKSWMLFDHIRQHQVRNVTITHVKADLMQGAILCSQRVHGPTVSCSHATGRRIFAMIFLPGKSHASNCSKHLYVVPWVSHVSNISQHVEYIRFSPWRRYQMQISENEGMHTRMDGNNNVFNIVRCSLAR